MGILFWLGIIIATLFLIIGFRSAWKNYKKGFDGGFLPATIFLSVPCIILYLFINGGAFLSFNVGTKEGLVISTEDTQSMQALIIRTKLATKCSDKVLTEHRGKSIEFLNSDFGKSWGKYFFSGTAKIHFSKSGPDRLKGIPHSYICKFNRETMEMVSFDIEKD